VMMKMVKRLSIAQLLGPNPLDLSSEVMARLIGV